MKTAGPHTPFIGQSLAWGRFSQMDTLDAPLDPANANRYAFAANDPINNSDPLGLFSTGDAVGGIGGTVLTGGIGVAATAAKSTPVGLGISFVGGCLTGAAAEAIGNRIDNEDTDLKDLAGACGVGAVSGVLGFGFGKIGDKLKGS